MRVLTVQPVGEAQLQQNENKKALPCPKESNAEP